jgi:Phage envelope protein
MPVSGDAGENAPPVKIFGETDCPGRNRMCGGAGMSVAGCKNITVPLKTGGAPWFADVLYPAGVLINTWTLPGCDALYVTVNGVITISGIPLRGHFNPFRTLNTTELYRIVRGPGVVYFPFRTFLAAMWAAGVAGYTVDMAGRTVTCYGPDGDDPGGRGGRLLPVI